MIAIENIRRYTENDSIFMTNHATERCRQRGILAKDIRAAIMNGEIIEQYPDDFPFPSCLIYGKTSKGAVLHVCISDEGKSGKVITAYFPSEEKWNMDFKTRKEVLK